MAGKLIAMLRGGLRRLKRIGVEPESAPPSVVIGLALLPGVVAGVIFFRLTALEMLGLAIAIGLAAYLAGRLLGQRQQGGGPLLPAVVGVALIGSGASPAWAAAVAVAAGVLELGRVRFLPGARLQVGLLAYSLVLLAAHGGPAVYASPGGTTPMPEPIRLWQQFSAGELAPIDPVRLYVGNVPGPVFATSMLAVAVGAAWLWYARRLSLLVVLTFLLGALVPIVMHGWAPGYQLDSGPLWFAAALVLADRRTLPASGVGRPMLGFAAGLVALGARTRGFAIESALVTVAAMQVLAAAAEGASWVRGNREEARARLRDLREAMLALGRQAKPRRAA